MLLSVIALLKLVQWKGIFFSMANSHVLQLTCCNQNPSHSQGSVINSDASFSYVKVHQIRLISYCVRTVSSHHYAAIMFCKGLNTGQSRSL